MCISIYIYCFTYFCFSIENISPCSLILSIIFFYVFFVFFCNSSLAFIVLLFILFSYVFLLFLSSLNFTFTFTFVFISRSWRFVSSFVLPSRCFFFSFSWSCFYFNCFFNSFPSSHFFFSSFFNSLSSSELSVLHTKEIDIIWREKKSGFSCFSYKLKKKLIFFF